MKAIVTKYMSATAHYGSKIKATAEGVKPLTIPFPHEFSGEACHRLAAEALRDRQGWQGELVSGGLPDQTGWAFCFANQKS
jgi:hypothetical protein